MGIGSNITIKATNQKGVIIGQAKGFWIVELSNGNTTLLATNKLKQNENSNS